MTRTLVAWFPDWPVTAAGFGPAAHVAVVHANRVVACSAAARAAGVRRGLRRREAQARCPELLVVAADPDGEARAFEPVVARLDNVCPRVEVVRPGVVALGVRGPARWFGGEAEVAVAVRAAVEPAAGTCQVGIADGTFAASLAARAAPAGDTGALIVPAGEAAAFLAPHPVDVLDRPELAGLLRRLGVRSLGDFAALPPAAVLSRFGTEGAAAHRLARGLDERPLAARRPPPELAMAATLDPPAERVDAAAFVAKSLADDLHAALRQRGLACTRIVVEAETEHGERLSRLWRHDGALSAAAVAERVRWQLDGWLAGTASAAERPTAGITLLRLTPDEVHADHGRQDAFWGGTTLADERAARALARVQGLLGHEGVCTPVVIGGRGPADRVALVPWGDDRRAVLDGRQPAPWPGALPPPAPAVVHQPPLPATVLDEAGHPVVVTGRGLISAPPARLALATGAVAIVAWAGPWPADERWWDPPARRRRARLQVVGADGVARLVGVEGGSWSVEATYD